MEERRKSHDNIEFTECLRHKERFSPLQRQLLVAANPWITTVSAGVAAGFSGILLPQLRQPDSTIKVSLEEESWIASICVLPMILGCIIGGFVMDKYGRKFTQLISCPVIVIGWFILAFAPNLAVILVGRLITGLCSGFTAPSSMVYVGETSAPKYRGLLLSFLMAGLSIGMFIAHILGTFFSWRVTCMLCAILPIVAFFVIFFVPESPTWLAGKLKASKAEESFLWCRGSSTEANEEMKIMIKNQTQRHNKKVSRKEFAANFRKREFLIPFTVINIYFVITQLAGVNTIPFYSIAIMKDIVGDNLDNYACMLLLDMFRVINAIIGSVLTKQMGRRPLTMISGVGTTVSLVLLAISLRFFNADHQIVPYLKLTILISYISFITVGLLPLPWTMVGELFPPEMRGFGSGVSSSISFLTYFFVVKSAPTMFLNFGADGTFALFGVAAFVGTIYLYFFLPETKDKTLQQIEDHFKDKTNREV